MNDSRVAKDSVLYSIIRLVTMILGIFTTAILSKNTSLESYGLYSSAIIIISFVTSLSIFGLTDGVNYFFNNSDINEVKEHNIDNHFGLQAVIGIIFGVLLISLTFIPNIFVEDFKSYVYVIAFLPLSNNILAMQQMLFFSIGKSRFISIRNVIISIIRLMAIIIVVFWELGIIYIFIFQIIIDYAQIIYFYYILSFKFKIKISPKLENSYIRKIINYVLPISIFVFTSYLLKDMDKYLVSMFYDLESLAIFSNASKPLPVDIINASLIVIIAPIITYNINQHRIDKVIDNLKMYISASLLSTWGLLFICFSIPREIILLLYGSQYLPGLRIFVLYLIVDGIKILNLNLLFKASGETKHLIKYSIISIIFNLIFSLILNHVFGIIGIAVGTVLSISLVVILIAIKIDRIMKINVIKLIFNRDNMQFFLSGLLAVYVNHYIKDYLYNIGLNYVIIMVIVSTITSLIIFIINIKIFINFYIRYFKEREI